MCGNLNVPAFVILLLAVSFVRNFYPAKALETTKPPIDVVDVEAVDNSTTVSSAAESYVCKNSFDIQSFQEFKEKVLNSSKTIFVQFHAPWSDVCSIITPRIARAIDDKGGKLKLARVDIDKHEKIGLEIGVQVVPCLVALRAGEVIEKLTGLKEESDLKIFFGKYIVD